MPCTGTSKPSREVDEVYGRRQYVLQGWRRAARVDHAQPFAVDLQAEVHRVQQEGAIELGGLERSKRRNQTRFCKARLGRLADHDQRAAHGLASVRQMHGHTACTGAVQIREEINTWLSFRPMHR